MRLVWLSLLLGVSLLLAVGLGAEQRAPGRILAALTGWGHSDPVTDTIVWTLRLPRALLGVLVGAALGVAGTITQAIMRNPLAEPGLLGINAGAALAAMVLIVELRTVPQTALPWLTFCGALTMTVAIFLLAWRQGTTSLRLILVGLGLSALAGAGASFIATFGSPVAVQRALIWMAGSLQDSRWIKVELLALWLIIPMALTWLAARELDLIAFDAPIARGLGQRVNGARAALILAVAALSGAAVAAAGLVAFVGLAAPHVARHLVGHRHSVLLPASALSGAILVVVADTVARQAMPPSNCQWGW